MGKQARKGGQICNPLDADATRSNLCTTTSPRWPTLTTTRNERRAGEATRNTNTIQGKRAEAETTMRPKVADGRGGAEGRETDTRDPASPA